MPFSRGSSQPKYRTGSPALQADSLLSESPGKPSQLIFKSGGNVGETVLEETSEETEGPDISQEMKVDD